MAKHVRMSITVPAEIKARMDAMGDPPNWSAIASRAFEAELAERIKQREIKDMKDVVTRLRESKQKLMAGRRKAGYQAGQEWAKERAEVEELERLRQIYEDHGSRWDSLLCDRTYPDAYSLGEHLVFWIYPEDDGNRYAAADFWRQELGEDPGSEVDDPEFLKGFADGALDVWREVKDQL